MIDRNPCVVTEEQPQQVAQTRHGDTYDHARDGRRLAAQHHKVLAFMRRGEWVTLTQIANHTGAPEASASARLRDLRRPEYGAYVIERRYVRRGLHEYRLLVRQPELFA